MNLLKKYELEGLIRKTTPKKIVLDTLIRNHNESLKLANNTFDREESFLWVVVISYYSMFYLANVYIYKKGYKINNKIVHKVVNDVLHSLVKEIGLDLVKEYLMAYEEALILSQTITSDFSMERIKRANFQYETTEKIKKSRAWTSLNRAKNFSEVINVLI